MNALKAQEGIESRVAALKKLDSGNATSTKGKELSKMKAEADRQAAEHSAKMGEMGLAAEREQSQVGLAIQQASIAQRLAADTKLADNEYRMQLAANGQLQSALDKGAKDYQNQLRALQDRAVELTAQHQNALAQLQGKATEEQNRKDLQDLEQSTRERIAQTGEGEAARLAVITAAVREEQAKGLQNLAFYRELMTEREETARRMATEAAKLSGD